MADHTSLMEETLTSVMANHSSLTSVITDHNSLMERDPN